MHRCSRRLLVVLVTLLVVAACCAAVVLRMATPALNATPSDTDLPTPRASQPTDASVNAARGGLARLTERWRVALPVKVVGLPAVDAAGIVVGADFNEIVAVSLEGVIQWTTPLEGVAVSAPRLDGDLVLVGTKRAIVALRRSTGEAVWSTPTAAEGDQDDQANRPVAVKDLVVATVASGRAYGLDRATGAPRWSVDLPTAAISEPTVAAGLVVTVGIGEWSARDPATGREIWGGDLDIFGTSSPVAFLDGTREMVGVATSGRFLAVDAQSGNPQWDAKADLSELSQQPVVAPDGLVVVPDHWGRIRAFDPHDGRVAWRSAGSEAGSQFGQPAVIGSRLVALFLNDDGPRIASPASAQLLDPPGVGFGVAVAPGGGLVVTTVAGPENYILVYDLDRGE